MKAITGGEFLIRKTTSSEVFIPEEWSEEQIMMKKTCDDFVSQQIIPNIDRIDALEEGLMPSILKKAGELGLLGVSVPEDLNGLGMDFKSSMLVTESLGAGYSFSVAYGAHTGIGTLPVLYYGNEEQRKVFASKLSTGEWLACYCLTEPESGSDANSGKTKAVLSEDGKNYVISGQKMWITNAGFADLFTVFAKIDNDENLTAFLLTKDMVGIELNAEEKKMGIKGSSTRQVFFNQVVVPTENMLSERGNGFKIAVNILNIGRIKLAGGVLGGAKGCITEAVKYALARNQFGRSISKYGAIKSKLGEMAIRSYALESALYRATQNIDDAIEELKKNGVEKNAAVLKGIASFAPECAMLKVYGSETLDFVVDESVQIFGGMGYSAESMVERAYRDSRINRIFEGTNEINRMLTVDMILKKAMKGELDLMGPAMNVANELMSIPDFSEPSENVFERYLNFVEGFKKSVLMIAGSAAQKLMMQLAKEQEILMNIADMCIFTYIAESTVLRTQKRFELQPENSDVQLEMMKTLVVDLGDRIHKCGKDALYAFTEGDEQRMMLMGLRRFTKTEAHNVKDARRKIADALIQAEEYCF
ncbi:MAG: acyl-CoA dehydrogenase family protein [Bacteroidota bacterium]|jgi:alkylation response protein AidB-like acyl-CoA dehydrogenase